MTTYKNNYLDITVTLKFPEPVTLREATRQAREGMMHWTYEGTGMDGISDFSVAQVGKARITARRKPGKKTEPLVEMLIRDLEPRAGEVMVYCEDFVRFVGIGSDIGDVYYIVDRLDRFNQPERVWLSAVGAITPIKGLIDDHAYAYHDKRLDRFGCPQKPFVVQQDDGFKVATITGKADTCPNLQERLSRVFVSLADSYIGARDIELSCELQRARHYVKSEEMKAKLKKLAVHSGIDELPEGEISLRRLDEKLKLLAFQREEFQAIKHNEVETATLDALREMGADADEMNAYTQSLHALRAYDFRVKRREELCQALFHSWYALDYDLFTSLRKQDCEELWEAVAQPLVEVMPFAGDFLRPWLGEYPGLREHVIALTKEKGVIAGHWMAQAMIFASNDTVRANPKLVGLSKVDADLMLEALAKYGVPLEN